MRLCMGVHGCNARIHEQVHVCGRGRKCACAHVCMRVNACMCVCIQDRVLITSRSLSLSGGYAGRCWRPRSPCRCCCSGYARRCRWTPLQSLLFLGYAARCISGATVVMLADAGAPAVLQVLWRGRKQRNFKNIDGLWFSPKP